MPLIILRCVFFMAAAGLATVLVTQKPVGLASWDPWAIFLSVLGIAGLTITVDSVTPRKRVETISAIYFGLIVGLLLTWTFSLVLTPLLGGITNSDNKAVISTQLSMVVGLVLCYSCISLLIQTKDDFRFIIPYIEFAKEVKGLRPYVLDTSVVIDGRIADVVEANIMDNQLVMPRFVLAELQNIADSSDKMRRARGRRGLDILNRLRNNEQVEFKIYDREHPDMHGQPVDMKLVLLAKHMEGKVVTGDYNLNKVARLHNVPVINLNDVANALKPVFLPGEKVEVKIVKVGEEPGQGVGYLDDGTMIVVENGREHQNRQIPIVVTSVLQTSAGRMIFGRYDKA